MKDFSRVHDVVWIECLLDGLHHADRTHTSLGDQEVHFVQTNAVLALLIWYPAMASNLNISEKLKKI